MRVKVTWARALLLICLVGIILSAAFIFSTQLTNIIPTAESLVKGENKPNTYLRLKIPKINVDATIESVGLTSEGAMEAPSGPDTVGWFKFGPRPGELGSSVIDGHSGWKNNIPAVFDNLYKLTVGDKIYIQDENGVTSAFVVRDIQKYKQQAETSAVFNSTDGKVHLNLITCAGSWDESTKSSEDRIVIFTDIE
jgi:sortase A